MEYGFMKAKGKVLPFESGNDNVSVEVRGVTLFDGQVAELADMLEARKSFMDYIDSHDEYGRETK